MSNLNQLSGAIRFALFAGAASAISTAAAFAQDAQAPATLDRVEVTGSRIKRVDAETSQPVLTLDKEAIRATGLTSIGDIIQQITANGSTLNSTFNNGGNGETRVSLRNLGSNRTLVLVNGRRWVGGTGLGGAVDLNTIPTAMVERIDVLKDGASTLYGSDAIAGVVNVVLRNEFDGAEANSTYSVFDQGDGEKESFDVTIGSIGERSGAVYAISYVKEDPVLAGDRKISAEPTFGTGNAFGSSTTPNGRFGFGTTACQEQTATGELRFNPDGTPRMVAAGNQRLNSGPGATPFCRPGTLTRDDSSSPFRLRTGDDLYNFAPDNYLLTPQERVSFFGRGYFDLTDNVRFVASTTYNNRKSEQLLAAMPIVLGFGPGAGAQARNVFISKDNIYNPFGVDVTRTQRRAVETGGRSFVQNVDTFAFSGNFEGTFEIADRYFSWDAGYIYARNDQNDTTEGLFNVLALSQALGPSMLVNGTPTCVTQAGNAATRIAGCVPLNLLGGVGTITPEMLAFTSFVAHDELQYKMKDYFANLSGDIIELPAGMMSFAAGIEHRTEFGFDQPDALIASGNTTGNARTPTKGGYSLDEVYLELAIPLLSDLPMAKSLELSVASRYSDYSNFGDTTNSKIGLKWKPIDDLLIRGNWAEGFRAPAVGELFQGVADSFPQIADPCANAGFGSLSNAGQARCVAQGVPAGGYDQGNPQIRISVGGNPDLTPETSTSYTLGFVYSPSQLEGFDMSLDWWDIKIKNNLTALGGQFILDSCIRQGNAANCALFTRQAGGAIDELFAFNLNQGSTETEGYDLTLNYRLPDTAWGSFSFSLDSTYVAKVEDNNDGDNQVGEYFDRSNNWRLRSNLSTRWEKGDFGAVWNARYYSAQVEDCQTFVDYGYADLCSDPNRFIDVTNDRGEVESVNAARNHIGATTYHDISAYWKAPWDARITLGVNNVFDKQPPRSVSTFANSFDPQYEVPGQVYFAQYSQKF